MSPVLGNIFLFNKDKVHCSNLLPFTKKTSYLGALRRIFGGCDATTLQIVFVHCRKDEIINWRNCFLRAHSRTVQWQFSRLILTTLPRSGAPAPPMQGAAGLCPPCPCSRFPSGPPGTAQPWGQLRPGPSSAAALVLFLSVARQLWLLISLLV